MSGIVLSVVRWSARLAALALAVIYVFMIIAEFASPHSGPPTYWFEWAGIGLLTLTCVGAVLAWKWELPGAVVSLASLILFMILIRARINDIVILVIAAPSLLFLADWLGRHPVRLHRH